MTPDRKRRTALGAGVAALLVAAAAGGYLLSRPGGSGSAAPQAERKILYWYDPMVPNERYDGPGVSSMGMKLIPKYADEAGGQAPGVTIDAREVQNLGARIVEAKFGALPSSLTATGVIAYNERDVAIVQARAGGFVERVYRLAPNDSVRAGAPIADVLIPEWAGAQQEYLALRNIREGVLATAARRRLVLLGMPPAQIAAVDRTGRVQNVVTIRTPVGGVVRALNARQGMTLGAGQTLAEINGLGTVWINAAIPEALAQRVKIGAPATVSVTAFPGEQFHGRVTAILPQAETESRTLTARIEIANRDGRLRPGMFAGVAFEGQRQTVLLVPSEAVIRTGTRDLVMLAEPGGRFRPAEVRVGDSAGGQTEILAGLAAGERVVASGQFLIDSEASIAGLKARAIGEAPSVAAKSTPAPGRYSTTGILERIMQNEVTIDHQAVAGLGWPAMTMTFRVADAGMLRGWRRGDRVRFSFDREGDGAVIRSIARETGR